MQTLTKKTNTNKIFADLPKNSLKISLLKDFKYGLYCSLPVSIQKKRGILTIQLADKILYQSKINCQKTLNAKLSSEALGKLIRLNKLGNLIVNLDKETNLLSVKMIESPRFKAIIR